MKTTINCKYVNWIEFIENGSNKQIVNIGFINGKEKLYTFENKKEAENLYSYISKYIINDNDI